MKIRKLKYIIIVSFIIMLSASGSMFAKGNTPSSISFGGDVNGNIYFADFNQFGKIENCCTNFGNTFGIGYNFHAGFEYKLPTSLFGMPWRLDLSFAYSDLSATFEEQEAFSNIIIGNSYTKGISKFEIKPDIKAIIFDPGIFFDPINNLPLSLRLGVQIGFFNVSKYSQKEQLISPEDVYFENGKRIRGEYSGKIPDAETQYFAISFAARYRAATLGNLDIYPSLRFNYGLNNLVQKVQWSASVVQGGISFVYNIPKAPTAAPQPPPMPPMSEPTVPPAPSTLEILVHTELNGVDGDEFELPYRIYQSKLDYFLLPIIFFKENSAIPIKFHSNTINNIGELSAQNDLLTAVAVYWKQHPEYNITLHSSALNSESDKIIDSRISQITNGLVADGVDISSIKVVKQKTNVKQYDEPALREENIFIKIELPDNNGLIPYSITQTIRQEFANSNILMIKPEIKTSDPLTTFEGKVYKNKTLLKTFGDKGTEINLNNAIAELITEGNAPYKISIDVFAKNKGGAKFNVKKDITLSPVEERRITEHNIFQKDNADYSQYILCYFDFDSDNPKIINSKVLELVRKAIKNGKKVQLLPLTDNLGEKDYNKNLARARANAASKLLQNTNDKVEIVIPEKYIFDNKTPAGRMLNRTVVVRIEK